MSSTSAICKTDPYFYLQAVFSAVGIAWLIFFSPKLKHLAALPDDAWRTHLLDDNDGDKIDLADVEQGDLRCSPPLSKGANSKQA
jgi:hypothetical protein